MEPFAIVVEDPEKWPLFWHFTTWNAEDLDTSKTYGTGLWQESRYWTELTSQMPRDMDHPAVATIRRDPTPLDDSEALMVAQAYHHLQIAKEGIFEQVRQALFSDRPSRQRCMYLLPEDRNPGDLGGVMGLSVNTRSLIQVAVIEKSPKLFYADVSLLDCNHLLGDPIAIVEQAKKYWAGTSPDNPRAEVLFEGWFRIEGVILQAPNRL